MAKNCVICGKPSGNYMFCFACNKLKDEGKVVKCETCGKWHLTSSPCDCIKNCDCNKVEEPKVNERALFKPAKTEEQPSSEGTTETPGDQGNPNGAKDISNYEGLGGAGGGPSYDLGGRNAKSLPRPSSDFNEEGTIVVDIWVDRDGRVQNAQIGKGTNISNTRMRETAKQAALQSVFAPDKNAAELQKGTITYKFIIRQ